MLKKAANVRALHVAMWVIMTLKRGRISLAGSLALALARVAAKGVKYTLRIRLAGYIPCECAEDGAY